MPAPATLKRNPARSKETDQTSKNSSASTGEEVSGKVLDIVDVASHSESKPNKGGSPGPSKKAPPKKAPPKGKKAPAGKKGKGGGRKRKVDSDSDDEDAHDDYLESRRNVTKKANLKAVDASGKVTEITAAAFPSGGIRLGLSRTTRPGNSLHPRARGS